MTLLQEAYSAYSNPLLEKHTSGIPLTFEDLEASHAACKQVLKKSSENNFVSKKCEDLHQEQIQAYREAATKALREWARTEAPLEPMEENDTAESFVERCVKAIVIQTGNTNNSRSTHWPNWRLPTAKIVVMVEIRKRARATFAKYHVPEESQPAKKASSLMPNKVSTTSASTAVTATPATGTTTTTTTATATTTPAVVASGTNNASDGGSNKGTAPDSNESHSNAEDGEEEEDENEEGEMEEDDNDDDHEDEENDEDGQVEETTTNATTAKNATHGKTNNGNGNGAGGVPAASKKKPNPKMNANNKKKKVIVRKKGTNVAKGRKTGGGPNTRSRRGGRGGGPKNG